MRGVHVPFLLALVSVALSGCVDETPPSSTDAPTASPYAGQETRVVKALSDEDVAALLAGDGHGYAKAAELNHYPGPAHVLDMADALELSPRQREDVEAVRVAMKEEARALGRMLVDAEADLDALFASGEADAERVVALTREIGGIESDLRASHLRAHLDTRALLTPHQVARYDELRGYGDPEHDHAHG